MNTFLNIVILIFEILYFTLFMKFARKEGKTFRYIILFVLFTGLTFVIDKNFIPNYLIIFLLILYGLKYIVKLKINLFDLLFIIIMFGLKIIIETPLFLVLYKFIKDIYLTSFLVGVIKTIIVLILETRLKINNIYDKLKIKWNNNNFYIRYIFSILLYLYLIFCVFFLISKL